MLNHSHYLAWRNNDFGRLDPSAVRPGFIASQYAIPEGKPEPEIISIKQERRPTTGRRKPQVHTVGRADRTIDKDGFQVLVDSEGKVLTDIVLLAKLRKLRTEIAQKLDLPAYCVIQNDVLVRIATDMPVSREEFVAIKGLRDRKYEQCGKEIIQVIREHIKC